MTAGPRVALGRVVDDVFNMRLNLDRKWGLVYRLGHRTRWFFLGHGPILACVRVSRARTRSLAPARVT